MRYLAIVFVLLITNCSNNGETKNQKSKANDTVQKLIKPLNGDVTIDINLTELPGKQIQINGKTNLPPNTNLMLSIEERMAGGFIGESECIVASDGSFISEGFGPPTGLKNGLYIAEVMMPIPSVQPDDVKKIIGTRGENLTGILVESDQIGVTVSAKKEFSLGINAAQDQQQRENDVQKSIKKLQLDMCILLERLLVFKDKKDFKEYGFSQAGPYYKWLKDVEDLRAAQPIGSHPIPLLLRAAPGSLFLLGMAYMRNSYETEYTQRTLVELKQTIGYASYLATKKRTQPM